MPGSGDDLESRIAQGVDQGACDLTEFDVQLAGQNADRHAELCELSPIAGHIAEAGDPQGTRKAPCLVTQARGAATTAGRVAHARLSRPKGLRFPSIDERLDAAAEQ